MEHPRFVATLARLLDQRGLVDRALVVGLGLVVGLACLLDVPEFVKDFPAGIDFEIPMRAASRWANGGLPYPPAAMQVAAGPDMPYLYPPYLLPIMAPLVSLPRDLLTGAWLGLGLLVAVWTCRRLALPWLAIPFVLAWPPFLEPLIVGNTQLLSFAAFVALFTRPGGGAATQRPARPPQDGSQAEADSTSSFRADLGKGVLAAAVAAFKVTQILPLVYVARRRRRAAVLGVAALATIGLVMLPFTGFGVYGEWLAQLVRAADPVWITGGEGLGRYLGWSDFPFAIAGLVVALTVRGRDAAAWVGIAIVVSTPVHGFTFLFLLPGLLAIRRDLAIPIGALFIGVYHVGNWWLATGLVAAALAAMRFWPCLRAADRREAASIDEAGDGGPGWRERAGRNRWPTWSRRFGWKAPLLDRGAAVDPGPVVDRDGR